MSALQITILVSAAILAIFFKVHRVYFNRRRKLHRKNIKKSKKMLAMFRQWKGSYIDARIINFLRKPHRGQPNPFVFEELILTALKNLGVKIKRNTRYTGDGGIDGTCWLNGHKCLIQVKRYESAINPQHIVEFSKVCNGHQGLFVHTGRTGKKSKAVVPQNIIIISGNRLTKLILGKLDKEQINVKI